MDDDPTFRYTLRHLLATLALVAVGLGLIVNFGPLSAVIACLAKVAMLATGYRYYKTYRTSGNYQKLGACICVTVFCVFVFAISASFWMHTHVRSNRLNTIYGSSSVSDLNFSIFRGKVLFVTVSGTVKSETSFDAIRSDIRHRFKNDPSLHIKWNVRTNDRLIHFDGSDRELFPNDYETKNAA